MRLNESYRKKFNFNAPPYMIAKEFVILLHFAQFGAILFQNF